MDAKMDPKSGSPERREFDRRGFLQLLVGSLASVPAVAAAQTAPTPTTPPATTPPAATPPAGPEHSGGEARLLTEVLRARYPDRLSEAQWGLVVTDFDGDLGGAKRLRATKLKNSDEPDFLFRP